MTSMRDVDTLFVQAGAADAALDELQQIVTRVRELTQVLATARQARAHLARLDPVVIERALLLRGRRRSGAGA